MKKPTRTKRPAPPWVSGADTAQSERPRQQKGERAAPSASGKKPRLSKPRPSQPPPPPLTAEATDKLDKITGLQAVTALFKRDHQRVMRLYYGEEMKNKAGEFCAQMARLRRPYRLVEEEELTRIAGTPLHGGLVAAALPREIAELDLNAAQRWAKAGEPLVILDGIGNPHNLGAIARTLAFFGIRNLVISDHPAQAGLSDAAYRIAEGGLEYLGIYRAHHLPQTIKQLRPHYRFAATSLSPRALHWEQIPPQGRPLALVFGNEENGLPHETAAACELAVTLPGSGWVQSLNVAASAAIMAFELSKTGTRKRTRPTV